MIVGLGLDLAEIERYCFDSRSRDWFARRVYTAEEFAYAMRGRHWPQHLAGFFAAKESVRKACGQAFPWREIGVGHAPGGAPLLAFSGTAQAYITGLKLSAIHLTITHTEKTAAAVVILERA